MTEPPDNVVILRPCHVDVEFTEEELATIRARAAERGLTLEDYMRLMIFDGVDPNKITCPRGRRQGRGTSQFLNSVTESPISSNLEREGRRRYDNDDSYA
jgi:hypothetical protein